MPIHHPLGFKQHPLEDAGSKWVILPTYKWGINGGEITH